MRFNENRNITLRGFNVYTRSDELIYTAEKTWGGMHLYFLATRQTLEGSSGMRSCRMLQALVQGKTSGHDPDSPQLIAPSPRIRCGLSVKGENLSGRVPAVGLQ